ncbi:MAG: hypothetical protein ACFE0I_24265 [Elainellaceae cyanobacterium]
MTTIAERYTKLCRAYTQLAERFQKLDVEYMTLKSKLPEVLQAVRSYKQTIATLKQEKASVESELQTVKAKYEQLKPFEDLLTPEFEAELLEAEEQASLVEQTIQEMLDNPDPDLNDIDKQLLLEFQNDTDEFLSKESNGYYPTPDSSSMTATEQPAPTP